jgi:CheY-like chemotaxis protein
VDDDEDGRFLMEWSLKGALKDCSVVVCSSADEAVQRLESMQPDAIVTDHQLGRQSGCEFIGYLRRRGLTCPVVMVTCSDDPDVARDAYAAGASKVFRAGNDDFAVFLKNQLAAPPGV